MVVSLLLCTVSVIYPNFAPLSAVQNVFSVCVQPLRYAGNIVVSPFKGISNIYSNITADTESLTELKDSNALLEALNAELEETAQEASRLRDLLDLSDTYNLISTAARVISGSGDALSDSIIIDKGSLSGLSVGMPVTSATGVIGQIIECYPTTSVVRLLSDENSSISVMIQSNRAQGMLNGSITGEVTLALVNSSQTVVVGDVVVTSGLGGVFPKGLPIGRVIEVDNSPGNLYLDIVVSLYALEGSYEEVLVITSLTEEQTTSAEDIQLAETQDEGVVYEDDTTYDENSDY